MSFLDLLFPSRCLVCGKRGAPAEYLCGECAQKIPIHQTLFCALCGARLPHNRAVCHKDEPYLLGAATNYQHPSVKILIRTLKFKLVRGVAEPLTGLIIRYANGLNLPLEEYVVVPIPLGPRREKSRGFNQAELITQIFAAKFNLPLQNNLLYRGRETKPQSELKGLAERRTNLVTSFALKDGVEVPSKIILVDDVTTSGVTLHAAAEVLKQSGARKIIALTVARA